jgi:hypothetical protein
MHLHVSHHHINFIKLNQAGWSPKLSLCRAQEKGIKQRGKICLVRFDRESIFLLFGSCNSNVVLKKTIHHFLWSA